MTRLTVETASDVAATATRRGFTASAMSGPDNNDPEVVYHFVQLLHPRWLCPIVVYDEAEARAIMRAWTVPGHGHWRRVPVRKRKEQNGNATKLSSNTS